MSEFDRGAYTPQTDSPLSFDARTSRRPAGRPMPMALLVSCLILAVLIVAIVLFYRSGVRSAGQAPQPVGAPVTAMKAPPAEADQPVDPAAGLQVYKAEAPEPVDTPPTFTPGPEQPAARPVTAAPAPSPMATMPQAVIPLRPSAAGPAPAPLAAAPAPVVAPLAAPVATKPAASVPTAALPAKPLPVKPLVLQPKPSAPAAASVIMKAPPAAKPVAVKPVLVKPAVVKPAEAKPEAPKAAAKGSVFIQIGAFSSPVLADKGWSDIAKAFPGQMAGKTKAVEPLKKDTGTLYRTAIGGFASKADADKFCASLKAAGKTCFVKAN